MPLFPITFPFVFGLVEADTNRLDLAVNATADVGDGVLASEPAVTATGSATGQTSVVIEANLAVTATPSGSGGFGLRATPTVDVELTSDAVLDGHAAANLEGTATPAAVAAPGVTATTIATATSAGSANLDTSATATTAAIATVTADGLRATADTAALTTTGTATAAGIRGQSLAASSVTVTATLTAGMARTVYVDANLSGTANVSGDERKTRPADAVQAATVTASAGGKLAAVSGASMQCITVITADGIASNGTDTGLVVTAILSARAQVGPTPPERVSVIPVDVRSEAIAAANRLVSVGAESRTQTVPAITPLVVPADTRTMVVQRI